MFVFPGASQLQKKNIKLHLPSHLKNDRPYSFISNLQYVFNGCTTQFFFYTGFLEPSREASHTHMISSSAHGTCLAFDSLFFSVIVKWQYSMTAAFETFVQH